MPLVIFSEGNIIMVPKLTLIYFPGFRSRSEPARMIMAYGGIPYTFTDCEVSKTTIAQFLGIYTLISFQIPVVQV